MNDDLIILFVEYLYQVDHVIKVVILLVYFDHDEYDYEGDDDDDDYDFVVVQYDIKF